MCALERQRFQRETDQPNVRSVELELPKRDTKARCNRCHALTENERDATLFMDNDFHNIGIGILRHHVPSASWSKEIFPRSIPRRSPAICRCSDASSWRGSKRISRRSRRRACENVLVTGPYFHDGSMQTLWDVMDHYNKGDGITDPWLDKDMQPLALTEPEIDDVVAFLASLTSPQYKVIGDQEYARQLALSKVKQQTFRSWCTTVAAMTCPTMAPHNHACPQGINFEAYPGSGQGYQLGSNYYMNGYGTRASTGSGAPQTVTQPS
jgi:hypothetical protein